MRSRWSVTWLSLFLKSQISDRLQRAGWVIAAHFARRLHAKESLWSGTTPRQISSQVLVEASQRRLKKYLGQLQLYQHLGSEKYLKRTLRRSIILRVLLFQRILHITTILYIRFYQISSMSGFGGISRTLILAFLVQSRRQKLKSLWPFQ